MIRGDSELTSVHPKEPCARAPPVLPFQPCQGSARPCKPWQAFGMQPVFIHGNGLCNISSLSHQLLAADSYCCPVSSLKRQEKQIEWGEIKDMARPEGNQSGSAVWLWWGSCPKCSKNRADRKISAWDSCAAWVKGAILSCPFKLNWHPKYFSDELAFVCCSVRWSHPLLCSGPAALQLWQFAWPEGKEDWLGCFKVTLSYWDVACWFFLCFKLRVDTMWHSTINKTKKTQAWGRKVPLQY